MAQIFSNTIGGERLLSIWYPLRHHVRGAVYFNGPGCRNPRGPLHVQELGGRCVETVCPYRVDAQHPGIQRHYRRPVGILSVSGRGRSAGRNQFALAASSESPINCWRRSRWW